MDLNKLETFAAISELKSLSKAAIALQTLPSVVSRQIAALEREWGGKLFHRTGRGMTPTELGLHALPRVLTMLQEYKTLQREMQVREGVISGEVRIGLVPSLAQVIAATLFRDIQQNHPGIRLHLLEGVTAQLDEWRMNGDVDITVLFRAGLTELQNEESLGEVDTYLVGALGDPVTAEPVVRFCELEGLPLVLASMPNGLRADVEKEAQRQCVRLDVVLATNSLAVQTELAARGGAYTVMAGHAASQRMGAGLQAARIIEPVIVRKIALSVGSHRPASVATRLVARQTRLHIEHAFKTISLSPP